MRPAAKSHQRHALAAQRLNLAGRQRALNVPEPQAAVVVVAQGVHVAVGGGEYGLVAPAAEDAGLLDAVQQLRVHQAEDGPLGHVVQVGHPRLVGLLTSRTLLKADSRLL